MSTRGGLSDDRFYDRLDPDKVSDTLDQLQGRILEQFPTGTSPRSRPRWAR